MLVQVLVLGLGQQQGQVQQQVLALRRAAVQPRLPVPVQVLVTMMVHQRALAQGHQRVLVQRLVQAIRWWQPAQVRVRVPKGLAGPLSWRGVLCSAVRQPRQSRQQPWCQRYRRSRRKRIG